jgi:hypothetical protein
VLGVAFKEWAGVCRAVAAGEQLLLLRKGGIHEESGQFRPEHDRFWLYETHFHEQHRTGIKPAMMHWIEEAEANRPSPNLLRLTAFVSVEWVELIDSLDTALKLDPFHAWTAETVSQRFHYATPGLYVLAVRAFCIPAVLLPELPAYAGCKSWVPLEQAIDTSQAVTALPDSEFVARLQCVREVLRG